MLFGDVETARRIERAEAENHGAYVRAMRKLEGGEIAAALEVGEGIAAFTGVGSPLTQAFGLGLHGPVADADLDRLFESYRSRGAVTAVEVCNLADVSLPNALIARGCRVLEHSHVLGRRPGGDGLSGGEETIRRVTERDLAEWCDVVSRGFAEGQEDTGLRHLLEVFYAQDNSECYAAWSGLRIMAGGSVFFVGDIAIFGGTSTLPEERGRGAQGALLRHRLRRAAVRGAGLAVITTTPGTTSHRNAVRTGFDVLYARTKYEQA